MHNQTVSDSINDKQPRTATAVVRLAIWKREVHRAISTGSSLNMSANAVWPMFMPATENDPPMLDTISPAIVIHLCSRVFETSQEDAKGAAALTEG